MLKMEMPRAAAAAARWERASKIVLRKVWRTSVGDIIIIDEDDEVPTETFLVAPPRGNAPSTTTAAIVVGVSGFLRFMG